MFIPLIKPSPQHTVSENLDLQVGFEIVANIVMEIQQMTLRSVNSHKTDLPPNDQQELANFFINSTDQNFNLTTKKFAIQLIQYFIVNNWNLLTRETGNEHTVRLDKLYFELGKREQTSSYFRRFCEMFDYDSFAYRVIFQKTYFGQKCQILSSFRVKKVISSRFWVEQVQKRSFRGLSSYFQPF